MKQQIKTDWLRELASADYHAGNGFLACRPADSPGAPIAFSPLGVLCELAILAGLPVVKTETTSPWLPGYVVTAYNDNTICLPQVVADWAEMSSLPWMKLDNPSGIENLAYIGKLGNGSFGLAIQAIEQHL